MRTRLSLTHIKPHYRRPSPHTVDTVQTCKRACVIFMQYTFSQTLSVGLYGLAHLYRLSDMASFVSSLCSV